MKYEAIICIGISAAEAKRLGLEVPRSATQQVRLDVGAVRWPEILGRSRLASVITPEVCTRWEKNETPGCAQTPKLDLDWRT